MIEWRNRAWIGFLLGVFLVQPASAEAFLAKRIIVHGNQRIPTKTILHYLPVRAGATITEARLPQITQALFKTHFFSDVVLQQKDDALVIRVEERPTIGSVNVSGNAMISKDKINEVLKAAGLERGQVFVKSILEQFRKSLHSAYAEQGRYNASIKISVLKLPRNRRAIEVKIHEGDATKIAEIQLVGNEHFSQSKLLRQFDLSKTHLWSFISGSNRYSEERLTKDLATLKDFYLDRGFLRFKILSHKVSLTPDKKHVYITIHVKEGGVYHLSKYSLSGQLLTKREKLRHLINLSVPRVFSKKDLTEAQQRLLAFYGNYGYGFAAIHARPTINDKKHTVTINFLIQPGKRVYVHRIQFSGNTKTSDDVLRREMRQFEGGLVHTDRVKESLRRLRNLGYLQDVSVNTRQTPGSDDLVDLMVNVKEMPSAQAVVSAGYGTNGFLVNASLKQHNFLGTGRTVALQFDQDQSQKVYSFSYINPYYTMNGVSRSFHVYYNDSTPGRMDLSRYSSNSWGASMNYHVPLSDYSAFSLGAEVKRLKLKIGSNPATQLQTFVDQNGDDFSQLILTGGVDYSHLDQQPFTTSGWEHGLGVLVATPAMGRSLPYMKANYSMRWFHPLGRYFVLGTRGNLGYGTAYGSTEGGLPFFQNYFSGGPETVRGYESNSLGPRDSKNHPLGGNALILGSAKLVFPNPLGESVRTSVFLDGGNVYNTRRQTVDLGQLRYSTGLNFEIRLPMLAEVQLSWAKALNARSNDRTQSIQFTIGTSF